MTAPVKWIFSSMAGAPSMANNSFGSMITVLDDVLVNGFNTKTVTSLTRTGDVVRAACTGHSYWLNQVVTIAGASPSDYNGEFRVTNIATDWFEYKISTTPGAATGTITAKTSQLGFVKEFSGTHKGVYRSPNVLGNRHYLRVDNGTHPGWVSGRQIQGKVSFGPSMSDVDTFTAQFAPYTLSAIPDWGWFKWHQSHNSGNGQTSANNVSGATYVIVGDDRAFYFLVSCAGSFWARRVYGFGDFKSFKPADVNNVFLWATDNWNEGNIASDVCAGGNCGPGSGAYNHRNTPWSGEIIYKAYTGIGSHVTAPKFSLSPSYDTASGLRSGYHVGLSFPNGPNQSIQLSPSYVWENRAHNRGVFPGIFFIGNNMNNPDNDGAIMSNVTGYPDRLFIVLSCADMAATNLSYSRLAFDITGPWEY